VTYSLVVAESAARSLAVTLPEPVASAALGFMTGALLAGKWSARRGQ